MEPPVKPRPQSIPIRSIEGFDILPMMKKSEDMVLKKLRFQSKCHWTPDKEQLFREL